MKTQKVEVVMNIPDIKVVEKLVGKALAQLIDDKVNKLPIEHRREICEGILNIGKKNSTQKSTNYV